MVEHVPRNRIQRKQHRVSDVRLPGREKTTASHQVKTYSTRSFDKYEQQRAPIWVFFRSLFILLVLLGLSLFLGARLFARAHVQVVPHTIFGSIDTLIELGGNAGDNTYETMSFTREKVQNVLIEDFETQETKASGTIVVFNEEPREQRLREETRFETLDGLIFMLGKGAAVTIPAGTGSTPGSKEVTVYAQEPGSRYNIGPSDFVIPGWREIGDSRFDTQYARSKGPIDQGGSGRTPVISEEVRTNITQEIQAALREQMIAQAWVDTPDQFILFEDAVHVTYGSLALDIQDTDGTMSATASLSAELSAVLFHHEALAQSFTQQIDTLYSSQKIRIDNPGDMSVTLSPQSKVALGWQKVTQQIQQNTDTDVVAEEETEVTIVETSLDDTLRIRFVGDIAMTTHVEPGEIMNNLAQMPSRNIVEYFANIPEINNARVDVKPFWRRSLPQEDRITLLVGEGA